MSVRSGLSPSVRSIRPIALELGIVTAVLAGLYLWQQLASDLVTAAFGSPPAIGDLLVYGLVNGGLLLGGLLALVGTYATVRDIEVGIALPSRADLPEIGVAALAPVGLVGLTKLVGAATGVPYNSLTKTSVAADPPVLPILLVLGLGLLVGVPALAVICQVLVQGSFERAVGADGAVVLTTAVTGFVMVDGTGGLTTIPDRGKLAGAVVFALLFGVALFASERTGRDWLRYLGCVPVVAFAAVIVLAGMAGIDSAAGGLFAATQLLVLGVAAYTYDRTESLLVPALAYASLLLANRAVVVVFEAGMQSW